MPRNVPAPPLAPQTGALRPSGGLRAIWTNCLPILLGRVATIEMAVAELDRPSISMERLESGRDEAHKLAGVLGTFGLDRGTELARDLEEHLASPATGAEAARLRGVAAELRHAVELA